jgi:hypothetical protein
MATRATSTFVGSAVPRCSPAVKAARTTGHPLGLHPPAWPAETDAANLVPLAGAVDQRSQGIAGPAAGLGSGLAFPPCAKGPPKAKHGGEGG